MPTFRPATAEDIGSINRIYNNIHTAEETGEMTIGWHRGTYPTRQTAYKAVKRGDMFVELDDDGIIVGAAIINRKQVDTYSLANWEYPAEDDLVMVLHTLVIEPSCRGQGYGRAFVDYYEQMALANGCRYLRMDTNERNLVARRMYNRLGYKEIDILPCTFNGLEGVNLVCLEKYIRIE